MLRRQDAGRRYALFGEHLRVSPPRNSPSNKISYTALLSSGERREGRGGRRGEEGGKRGEEGRGGRGGEEGRDGNSHQNELVPHLTSYNSNDGPPEPKWDSIADGNIHHTVIELIVGPRVRNHIPLVQGGLQLKQQQI